MPDEHIKILIVDDNPSDRVLIGRLLAQEDEPAFVVSEAECGADALQAFRSDRPDCILLDYRLPDFDGIALMHEFNGLKSQAAIVMMTGQGSESVAVEAMRSGAQDYLVKDHIDRDSLVRSVRYAIERTKLRAAERALSEARSELSAASKIQHRLFPKSSPRLLGFDIAGGCRPMAETGGDYYDFIPMLDRRLGIVVADVSSHGFAPALIMAGTRRLLRTLASSHSDIGEILNLANLATCEDTEAGQFVTLFWAALDATNRTLVHAGAGHDANVVRADGSIKCLPSTSLPLGVSEDEVYRTCLEVTQLATGDIVALLTDGFHEATTDNGVPFGIEQVFDVIRENRNRPADQIVQKLFQAISEFCAPGVPQDDVTAVIIKVVDSP